MTNQDKKLLKQVIINLVSNPKYNKAVNIICKIIDEFPVQDCENSFTVQVYKRVRTNIKVKDYIGIFRGFFNDSDGDIMALIEKEDGFVASVYHTFIQFIKVMNNV